MAKERYAINRADVPLEGLDGECWEFHMEVLPELVDALRSATPEQTQEIADYAFVATRFPDFVAQEFTSTGSEGARSHWRVSVDREHWLEGDTRAEALRELAETLKPEVTT